MEKDFKQVHEQYLQRLNEMKKESGEAFVKNRENTLKQIDENRTKL